MAKIAKAVVIGINRDARIKQHAIPTQQIGRA
jgi:hypothetical protein